MAIPITGNRDRRAGSGVLQMNHSIVTADRNTHLKVGALALAAALGVALVGFSAHVDDSAISMGGAARNGPVVKAGKVNQFATRFGFEVR
jgi:hypothetical protein